MKILLTILSLTLLASSPCFGETIIIFAAYDKKPKVYIEDGQAQGILIDIMKFADKHLSEQIRFELYPWSRAYRNMLNGEGGLLGISKNDHRQTLMDFSDVMFYDELLLIVRKGEAFEYQTMSDLQGKTMGILRGASYGQDFEQGRAHIFKVSEDTGPRQRLLRLLQGRIDVALLGPGRAAFDAAVATDPFLSDTNKFFILPKPFKRDPNFLSFAKIANKQDFLRRFNLVLQQGYASGEIQKIIANTH